MIDWRVQLVNNDGKSTVYIIVYDPCDFSCLIFFFNATIVCLHHGVQWVFFGNKLVPDAKCFGLGVHLKAFTEKCFSIYP